MSNSPSLKFPVDLNPIRVRPLACDVVHRDLGQRSRRMGRRVGPVRVALRALLAWKSVVATASYDYYHYHYYLLTAYLI